MGPYQVKAEWDDEASVWVASSDDVPGLATGADTLEALIDKLKVVIPELLEANGLLPAGAERIERAKAF
jgi:predicted RNase H-like HicB family nuclease